MPNVKKLTGFKSFVAKAEGQAKEPKPMVKVQGVDLHYLNPLIKYLEDQLVTYSVVYLSDSAGDYLESAFIWKSTEQGYDYWCYKMDGTDPMTFEDLKYLKAVRQQYLEGLKF